MTRRARRSRWRWGDVLRERSQDLLLAVLLVWVVFPFFWAVSSSLRLPADLFTRTPTWLPDPLSFQAYAWALADARFVRSFFNSLLVSSATAVLAMTICAAAAYSLARFRYGGKKGIMTGLVFSQMLPRILIVIPIFVIFSRLQLVDTHIGLILGYATFAAPFAILMLRGFFANFPQELEDAALIDGCNRFQAFVRIVLPLTIPGVIATGLFAFVLAWSDLLFSLVLTRSSGTVTAAVYLNNIANSQFAGTNYGGILAAGVILTLPVVIIFVVLQNQLVKGLTAGAVKG
jgi:ABC-type glycerol-3-phosphate transport system permease component